MKRLILAITLPCCFAACDRHRHDDEGTKRSTTTIVKPDGTGQTTEVRTTKDDDGNLERTTTTTVTGPNVVKQHATTETVDADGDKTKRSTTTVQPTGGPVSPLAVPPPPAPPAPPPRN